MRLAAALPMFRPMYAETMARQYRGTSLNWADPMNRYVKNLTLTMLVVVIVARTTRCTKE